MISNTAREYSPRRIVTWVHRCAELQQHFASLSAHAHVAVCGAVQVHKQQSKGMAPHCVFTEPPMMGSQVCSLALLLLPSAGFCIIG
jgi:hypothetical protein